MKKTPVIRLFLQDEFTAPEGYTAYQVTSVGVPKNYSFKASNGILIEKCDWPDFVDNTLYLGGEIKNRDNWPILIKDSERAAAVLKAVKQANANLVNKKKPIKVKLNDEYTAEVHANKVVVGCQTIPIDKIHALVAALQKMQK